MKYLRRLEFCDCPTVSSLEFLSHEMMAELSSLEYLEIYDSFHSVRSFPLGVFPKLSTLTIQGCENLESFSIEGVDQNLSHLNRLIIRSCPNLASFPDGGLPTPNLRKLVVSGCKNLKSFPERIRTLTALERLDLRGLPNLVSFAQGGLPPNLQYFDVRDCDKVKRSVEWGLQGLVSLKQFAIAGEIWAPLLKEQLLLPTTLNGLNIAGLSSLKSVVDVKVLRHLASLHRLTIDDCPSLEFLPREGLQHLTSLRYLNIYHCPSLEFLPAEGLLHLTSLQRLRIHGCPKLQFLPDNGLPPSLSYLEIYSCSTLEKRYEDKTGEDWAKISHIPFIRIGRDLFI
ncbi:hypothetical protein COP2_006190 [Malus domestica]